MSGRAATTPAPRAPAQTTMLAIETDALTKRFGGRVAVDGIDLAVPTGSVYGFLGPNGSGKTTTIRMLLGLAAPTGGSVRLLGAPVPEQARQVLPRVGALIEGPAMYPWLSGRDNLRRLEAVDRDSDRRSRDQRIGAALERVGLSGAAGRKYKTYSLGMRQRLGIAAALTRPRDLLVLDEPTNGLDPQGTREVRAIVRALAADGTTVLLSSHLLSEVEQTCTHVGVMSVGRLVLQDTVAAMRTAGRRRLVVVTPDAARAAGELRRLGLPGVSAGDGEVSADLGTRPSEEMTAALVRAGVRVRELSVRRGSLEDIYVGLTGEGFDVGE